MSATKIIDRFKHKKIATAAWRCHLEAQGFAIHPNVIAPETVADLILQVDGVIRRRLAEARSHSGHALRHLARSVPAVKDLACSSQITGLVQPVLGLKAFQVRSLFFDKVPGANWKVAWHQDLTIAVQERLDVAGFRAWSEKEGVAHVQPPVRVLEGMLTVRVHLDDCHLENGPIQVLPGSHLFGRLAAKDISAWRKKSEPLALEIPAGGVALMKPLLLHASSPALQPIHRRVIHLEFASKQLPAGLQWAEI